MKSAEDMAKKYDYHGRDLKVHIDVDFGEVGPVNFIVIDPVIFGTSAFIKVVDVATSDGGEFETVDGFEDQAFDKVLTPEANKVLSTEGAEKLLAPNQFSYQGLGVFSFPVRVANKVRVTLLMADPVPNQYERLHILVQNTIKRTKVVTKNKKSGIFG